MNVILVSAALVAFAANSLLTRAAIGGGHLDPASFALIRVLTGATSLAVLVRLRRARDEPGSASPSSWHAAWALTGYLAAFTAAYARIGAAAGALLLFGAVQVTMIGVGLARGERPRPVEWLGGALAIGGLVTLTLPGATATDFIGAALMMGAGGCWGAYSVIGRRSHAPLMDTARNFMRSTALLALPMAWLAWPPVVSGRGLALAAASGAIASGLGYTLWYTVLPSLSAWRAAILQLLVPILTAAAAVTMLHEPFTLRLIWSAVFVAAGVWLTASPRWRGP